MSSFLVLLAHGSSDKSWSDSFTNITSYACGTHNNVKLAFMELCGPSLEHVLREAVEAGFCSFKILPLFLAKGKHLKQDIPLQITSFESELNIHIELLPPLGEQVEISLAINDIIARILEA